MFSEGCAVFIFYSYKRNNNYINMGPDKVVPTDMEKKHVYDVYDRIAPHFSHTRYKPWPKIQKFINELPNGSLVYDVGCGNGKYLGVNKERYIIGTDRSMGLLATANEK